MIPVACDVQIQGLGRCFGRSVVHNEIFLTCPTTKTIHKFDVGHGTLSEVWGNYMYGVPQDFARRCESGIEHKELLPDVAFDMNAKELRTNGWSTELALSTVPTACFAIVKAVLDGKDADLVEKTMVDYVKVKVKRMKSTGGYSFDLNGEEIDLERALNETKAVIAAGVGVNYSFSREVVVDSFLSSYKNLFK